MSAARERSLPSLEYRLAKSVRPWQYFKAAELLNSIGITLDTLASSDGEEQVVKRQARSKKDFNFFSFLARSSFLFSGPLVVPFKVVPCHASAKSAFFSIQTENFGMQDSQKSLPCSTFPTKVVWCSLLTKQHYF